MRSSGLARLTDMKLSLLLLAVVVTLAVAGLVSGLVRPEPIPLRAVLVLTVAAAAMLGPAHYLGLRYFGRGAPGRSIT